MIALFVALGIAVLTLLVLLLWFVPHVLQQQAMRTAHESAQLREMLLDMLNEQEAVTLRQSQLSTSISYLQDQLEQIAASSNREVDPAASINPEALRQIEDRIGTLQSQISEYLNQRAGISRKRTEQDNESWGYLLSLLSNIQDRVGTLSTERTHVSVGLHAGALLEELEQEMQHLHAISNDIATLQWRLRRSLNERETNISALRARTSNSVN